MAFVSDNSFAVRSVLNVTSSANMMRNALSAGSNLYWLFLMHNAERDDPVGNLQTTCRAGEKFYQGTAGNG